MPTETHSRETSFGFLSSVHTAEHGHFGGYLIVSELGRPLEFHCTSPVRPSRAQEILYGPTLQAYLLGEQIGGTLLAAAKLPVRLLLTDQRSMLAVRATSGAAMAMVTARAAMNAEPDASNCCDLIAGGCQLELPPGFESDREAVAESIEILTKHVDLAEPFGRIHEAICEAQRIDGQSNHGQAA
jgi:hypothetical protein